VTNFPMFAAIAAAIIASSALASPDAPPQETATPALRGLLLVDSEIHPTVSITWTGTQGTVYAHTGQRQYRADADRTPLGGNISCYAAIGGSRLAKAAGHPDGAIVRVGFYKINNAKPFFDGVSADTQITATLKGIRFNQPVKTNAESIIQHIKYDRGEMLACGLPGDAREQFNLVSPTDTINDRVKPGIDTRQGVLDGSSDSMGNGIARVEQDGSVTMSLTFRYPVLRNLRDPWKSDLPGTFLEPYHFHIEFEVLPVGAPPLDRTPRPKIQD